MGTGEGEYRMEVESVDCDAVHYVDKYTRNYCPNRVIWDLTMRAPSRSVSSFYWLKADKSVDKGLIEASFDAKSNSFTLKPTDVTGDFSVLINPRMVDISKPVTFNTPKGTFSVTVAADTKIVDASMREVCDPYLAWVQEVKYSQLKSSEVQRSSAASVPVKQTITLKVKSKTYKAKKLKKKAAKFKIGAVASGGGKITYKLTKKAKKAKIKVSKAGKVKVPKKTKKGVYKIRVRAAAKGSYKAAKATVTIRVK